MYSKRRYKICICSVILDELESFEIIFFFLQKKSLTLGMKCEKLKFRKS